MAILSDNAFAGIPLPRLLTMQESYIVAIEEIATTGQSYTMPNGRSFGAAELGGLRDTLLALNQAVAAAQGTANPRVMVPTFPRGCRR